MSDSRKEQEDLRILEDQAYFELRQIIAEAMQYQDIELLDARISYWKNKYKKLLDRPSTSSKSDFKKRIEYLLKQYYSSITQYILDQLKLKEEKKVEKQAKAMKELYRIIKDTNDYDLLKKKIEKWKEKYPVDGFLQMYKKRIELYTRDKNIRENSFKQEEAFRDLVDITKKHATLDELNVMVEDWERKYSINNKYSIDDFLKHQREVERFTSDEFLQKIAREDTILDNAEKSEVDIASEYNNKSFSNLSVQASSYAALLSISKSHNNIDEMFKWVYKNRHIKFNDKYKELILSATYLDYSPTYLNKLSKPYMDMSKSSLSFDEYQHISDIKRYAIISYFNLLLPPEKAISNNYFTKNIQIIYAKSQKAKTTSTTIENVSSLNIDEIINSGMELSLNIPNDINLETTDIVEKIKDNGIVEISEDKTDISEVQQSKMKEDSVVNLSETQQNLDTNIEDIKDTSNNEIENTEKNIVSEDLSDIKTDISKPELEEIEFTSEHSEENIDCKPSFSDDMQTTPITNTDFEQERITDNILETKTDIPSTSIETKKTEEEFDYDTVVALSPLFIAAVNNLDKQATIIDYIDSDTNEYIKSNKSQDLEKSELFKTIPDIY